MIMDPWTACRPGVPILTKGASSSGFSFSVYKSRNVKLNSGPSDEICKISSS